MPSPIVVGSIVVVSAPDCRHSGKQGQVVGFDKHDKKIPVRVWFGRELDYLLDYFARSKQGQRSLGRASGVEPPTEAEQERDPRTWNFPHSELTLCQTWKIETIVERHFRGLWHHLRVPPEAFVLGARDCDVEGCQNATDERVLFNVWGSVVTADVCRECAPKYRFKLGDIFPWKNRAKTA